MNYSIIKEEQILRNFIDWLPELRDNEKYYLSLFARKKYCSDLIKSNDKTQLKRFTSTKEKMFDKIRQLEIKLNAWKLKEISAPQESLVLYILPNPRCMKKATEMMGKKCWDLIRSSNYNLHAEAMSCIQKSKSRACFVDFDIDVKPVDFSKLKQILPTWEGQKSYTILETKGGYHLLVDPVRATQMIKINNGRLGTHYSENWHFEIRKYFKVDQSGDQMIPVPGCVQSDFVPKFI